MKEYLASDRRMTAASLHWSLSASLSLVILITTACRRPVNTTQDVIIHQEIAPQPVRVGDAIVSVEITDKTAKPINVAAIMVEADMDHPGMGPIFKAASKTAPGCYQAHIHFNMGGDWIVLLHVRLVNGEKLERQMDVRGVRSN